MILEKLEKDIVIGDGGAIFELKRRGYVSAGRLWVEGDQKPAEYCHPC
jgi:hypothetical protein